MLDFLASNLIARTAILALVFVLVLLVVLLGARFAGRRTSLKSEIRAIASTGTGVQTGRMRLQGSRSR